MEANGFGAVPILTVCLPLRISIHRCGCFVDAITVPVKPHRYFTRLKRRIHSVHRFRKPLLISGKRWTPYTMPIVPLFFLLLFLALKRFDACLDLVQRIFKRLGLTFKAFEFLLLC